MTILKEPRFESKGQAQDFIRNEINPGKILSDREINIKIRDYLTKVSLLRLKLAGAIWFEGDPTPEDMVLQVRKMDKDEIRKITRPYIGATLSLLQAACKSIQPPEWAKPETDD